MKLIDNIKNLFRKIFQPKTTQQSKPKKINTQNAYYDKWYKFYANPNFYNTSINGYSLTSYPMYKKIIDEDGTIRSALRERKLKITSLNWEVFFNKEKKLKPFERNIQAKVEEWLGNIEIESKLYTMLEALEYGQAVFEIIYEYIDGIYEVVDLQKRNIEYFDYLVENQHLVYLPNSYLTNSYIDLTEDYPYQFIVHKNNANALNPHGESEIGLYGFVLYNMKKQFLIYYGVTGEKHGDPSLLASVNPYDKDGRPDINLENKLYDIAEEAIENLDGINSRAIIDERIKIEHLQQEIKNSFDYASAIELIKRLEEIHIKGSTLTSDTGEYGNYSTSETHERTTDSLIKADIKQLNNTVNRMIKLWIDLNFDTSRLDVYPEFRIIEPEVLDNERVNLILEFIDRGLEVKKKAIADEFNIPVSDDLTDDDCFNQSVNEPEKNVVIVDESDDEEIIEKLRNLTKKNGKSKVVV
jgi:phage gp29-like protein